MTDATASISQPGPEAAAGETETETETLSGSECLSLLGSQTLGRLAIVSDGQPDIFPVNYLLDESRVVIRSGEGTKLRHASLDRVAFEVDHVEAATGEAWSVVVKGTAREISTALDDVSERERLLPVQPMGAESAEHWLRIVPREITGRRISRLER